MDINLGNVVGLILSQTAPTKKYVLWGKVINPITLAGTKIYIYDYDLSQWVLLTTGGGGGTQIYKGPFNINTEYSLNDAVSYQNNIYQNIVPIPINTGNPFNPAEWVLIGATQSDKISFTIDNATYWTVVPTIIEVAVNQLAERVYNLENSPSIQYTIELYANTKSTTSNIFPIYGKVLLFGSENKSSKVTSVSYQTSTDGGDTWLTPGISGTFAELDTYLTTATTPTSFTLVRAIFTFMLAYVGEQAITLNYTQS